MKSNSLVLILAWVLLTLGACAQATLGPSKSTGTTTYKVINHSNYNPADIFDSLITQAANLDGYFQHASVGENICGGLDALALEQGSRYKMDRTGNGVTPPTWFDTHSGLADYSRGNPGASEKINLFTTAIENQVLATKVQVATYKFCYIDNPEDAQTLFNEAQAAMENLEATYPQVAFVWWTMPIETSGNLQRQLYNNLVRSYCSTNQKWLLDIADLESHDEAGVLSKDSDGLELLVDVYSADGGHLNALGSRKVALAWWKYLSEIALVY